LRDVLEPAEEGMDGPGARAAGGPRAVEQGLLAEIDRACALGERDASQLVRPLRVVVPSRALREQVSCALLERGRSRVGVRVQTLDALAREVIERAGESAAPSLLFGEAVRETARREPALAADLDRLDDGYAAVEASVADLLDAGFTELHLDPLLERAADAAAGPLLARANALLRVAARIARELAERTLGHRCAELARASELLLERSELLPTRALWIHGFADATGVQLDLLEVLARCFASRIWLDRPDPNAGSAFGARLRERLAPLPVSIGDAATDARVTASRHADPEWEARAAAAWARARIESGLVPERIAIVARDLARHRIALRRQLARFGVPFSGVAEPGATTPAGRQLAALCELLERGGALPAERWLDARARLPFEMPRSDLRDALHVLGIDSLADLAAAASASFETGVALPARIGLAVDEQGKPGATRRHVSRAAIAALRDDAAATLRHLESDLVRGPVAAHAARLAELLALLGWRDDTPGRAELFAAIAELALAGDRVVRREDWTRVLRRALADGSCDPLGGRGGGVQVLSVMEARARSFAALRVIGLNRGVFPRRIAEDPLLPDALRRALREVLPDLPIKGEGHEEERFLFAQLLAAAPAVHLSCAQRDASGRTTPASPLFERASAEPVEENEPGSPRDTLLAIASGGARAEFAAALPDALAAGRRALGLRERDTAPLARARLAALRELDPRDARRHELGPYLGAVGPLRGAADPRRYAPAVTHLERTARCPWQSFLERVLCVAPAPDAQGDLPSPSDRRRLGNVVHGALALAAATGRWPAEAPRELLLEAALEEARGIALRGFSHALARRAAPYFEVARRLDASESAKWIAVEQDGVATVRDAAGAEREVRFRADRVDEIGGERRLTDWKTGKRKSVQDHQRGLASGALIQVHAYAHDGARARYVYLDPELRDDQRIADADAIAADHTVFDASVATLLAARDAGAFLPRLRQPDRDEETGACRMCELRTACVRGDSGARMRLAAWAEAQRERSPLEQAALAIWRLPEVEK
jgi:PD-(D/E)XK nuclease superfamily protein